MSALPKTTAAAPTPPLPALHGWYHEEAEREQMVRGLFDRTARHYDWVCKAMAVGTGQVHRRRALKRAGFQPGMRLLDLATGTGLVAQAALDLGAPPARVTGLDPSRGMLAMNRQNRPIPLVQAGGEALPFADASFDFVSIGYALRHVADLGVLFRECRRVLAPGGRLLVLEIARPRTRLGHAACAFYLGRVVPWLARLWTRDPEVGRLMRYYWATIEACVPAAVIEREMAAAGFAEVQCRVTGGILRDYSGSM